MDGLNELGATGGIPAVGSSNPNVGGELISAVFKQPAFRGEAGRAGVEQDGLRQANPQDQSLVVSQRSGGFPGRIEHFDARVFSEGEAIPGGEFGDGLVEGSQPLMQILPGFGGAFEGRI